MINGATEGFTGVVEQSGNNEGCMVCRYGKAAATSDRGSLYRRRRSSHRFNRYLISMDWGNDGSIGHDIFFTSQ